MQINQFLSLARLRKIKQQKSFKFIFIYLITKLYSDLEGKIQFYLSRQVMKL